MTAPRNHRQAERVLISMVLSGTWRIDEHGQIWIARTGRRAEKLLASGYLMVRAMRDGRRICGLAHRLVWQHLHGDIPDGMVINHRNGLKGDNRPANLEVATYSANMKHAHFMRLRDQRSDGNPAAKLTRQTAAAIREMYAAGGWTMAQLGDRFGVTFQAVSKVVRGARRAIDGGPVATTDQRHSVCARDPVTKRFVRSAPEDLRVRQFPEQS